jgi:aminopeptidase N
MLAQQLSQIENPDRRARFAFIMPALSPSDATRDQFFLTLAKVDNRRHEPWVIDALAYLNHPLRARHAQAYIRPSLELLREIQQTGDIFFPLRWTDAVLGGHNSADAARSVSAFLAEQHEYPPRLRHIIEQSSDTLMRASRIVKQR